MSYASFLKRFLAILIDSILLYIVFTLAAVAFGYQQTAGEFGQTELLLSLGNIALFFIYYAGMESSSWQATLGKKVMGLTVVDLYGERISFLRALGRTGGKIISALILYIGFIMAAFTAKKQGLHDIMAGTLVLGK